MRHHFAEATFITEEEYLAGEMLAGEKHEYLNGFVYLLHGIAITNMAGATDSHVKLMSRPLSRLSSVVQGVVHTWQICGSKLTPKIKHGFTPMLW